MSNFIGLECWSDDSDPERADREADAREDSLLDAGPPPDECGARNGSATCGRPLDHPGFHIDGGTIWGRSSKGYPIDPEAQWDVRQDAAGRAVFVLPARPEGGERDE